MTTYTTDDCKKILVQNYPDTQEKNWKRVSKYKDSQGIVCRDFSYEDQYNITLKETPTGLMEKATVNYIIDENVVSDRSDPSLNQILFGGDEATIDPALSDENKFLHVLKHGIDWQASEGQRSAYDFSKKIDFVKFTKECEDKGINLAQNFINYICVALMLVYEMDETYMPHHITENAFDDSYPDLLSIQEKIEEGYIANGLTMVLNRKDLDEIEDTIENTRETMSCEDIDESKCNSILNKMNKTTKKFAR